MIRNHGLRPILLAALSCIFSGCGVSTEYTRAVKQGNQPWLIASETSSESAFQPKEIKVYKLVRTAISPEGQKGGLKKDKIWGEGQTNQDFGEDSAIKTTILVDGFDADNACMFKVAVAYSTKKVPLYTNESSRLADCDKGPLDDPFLKVEVPIDGGKWVTLSYKFHP